MQVVADMHHHLDFEKQRSKELEDMVSRLQLLCTTGLEQDIERLERRKRELVVELQLTDEAILERQQQLKHVHESLSMIGSKRRDEIAPLSPNNTTDRYLNASIDETTVPITPVKWPSRFDLPNDSITELERQYHEESEAYDNVKQALQNLLFVVHRNNAEDVVIYTPVVDSGIIEFVTANKIPDFSSISLRSVGELTAFEKLMVCKFRHFYLC